MTVISQRPFVYGTFRWPRKPFRPLGRIGIAPGEADIAIEIMREFSPVEFVGKLFVRGFGNPPWVICSPDSLHEYDWYQEYPAFRKHFYFDMAGSGLWDIIHFRTESDQSGPYTAIALRFRSETPAWVVLQRKRELGG
jgi:hypothetical protein